MLTLRWRSVAWHGSFIGSAVGSFLPWLVVAGRNRDGRASAELLLSLGEAGGLTALRLLGALWYAGAFAILIGWGTGTLTSARPFAWPTRACLITGAVAWSTFVVGAAVQEGILLQLAGPAAGLTGCAGLIISSAWPK